jgi:hypothetical protein
VAVVSTASEKRSGRPLAGTAKMAVFRFFNRLSWRGDLGK